MKHTGFPTVPTERMEEKRRQTWKRSHMKATQKLNAMGQSLWLDNISRWPMIRPAF